VKWKEFESDGYVKTPYFGRKIFQSHIENPTPSKVFNYILQAAEGEISIKYMNDAIKYLSGKKTIGVLYTYDSILFDYCKDDGQDIIQSLASIISGDNEFPVKAYIGNTYQNMERINI